MPDAVLTISAGTTGITALLVDHEGRVVASGHREITQDYPQPGWVECDAEEIWRAILASLTQLAEAPDCRAIPTSAARSHSGSGGFVNCTCHEALCFEQR